MAWTMTKVAITLGGTVIGGGVCFLTAGAAAPLVGAFIGSAFMGLSGAAATSAGLAALGGGAIAAGGGGMAAGTLVVTTAMTGAGALIGTLGAGTAANSLPDRAPRHGRSGPAPSSNTGTKRGRKRDVKPVYTNREIVEARLINLVAQVDGPITQHEDAWLEKYLERNARLRSDWSAMLGDLPPQSLNQVSLAAIPVDSRCALISTLCELACSDGDLTDAEDELLQTLAEAFEIDLPTFSSLLTEAVAGTELPPFN
jgi:hypothetical protein